MARPINTQCFPIAAAFALLTAALALAAHAPAPHPAHAPRPAATPQPVAAPQPVSTPRPTAAPQPADAPQPGAASLPASKAPKSGPAPESPTTAPTAELDPLGRHIAQLAAKAAPALVTIEYVVDVEAGRKQSSVAGIVVDDDGLVLTLAAAFPQELPTDSFKDVEILLPGQTEKRIPARFLGRDHRTIITGEQYGVAFIRATEKADWNVLSFDADCDLTPGQQVIAVGRLGRGAAYATTFALGRLAARIEGATRLFPVTPIWTVPPGCPVFTLDGKAAGIALINPSLGPVLMPASEFAFTIQDPPTPGEPPTKPWIGVGGLHAQTKELAEYYGLQDKPAVLVGEVLPGFPAEKAGLEQKDFILGVDGKPLDKGPTPEQTVLIFMKQIARLRPGQQIVLNVRRGTKNLDIPLTLGRAPKPPWDAKRFFDKDFGFTVRELVFSDLYPRKLNIGEPGVIVTYLTRGGPAQAGGLRIGDIVRKVGDAQVQDLDGFETAFQNATQPKPDEVVFVVLRGPTETAIVRIEPPAE